MISVEGLKKLEQEFNENVNSHVFLIETNNTDLCLKDIKDLIKKIIKAQDKITCDQIDSENYIEMIIIRPDGKEIKKDQILRLQERLKNEPILSEKLIYIINPANALSEVSANKLLKTIEEPNKHIIGFLITENIDAILPTIKSRCEILSLLYSKSEQTAIDQKHLQMALELVEALENNDHLQFSKIKAKDKNLKENAKIIENLIKDYYNTACRLSNNDFLDKEMILKIQSKYLYQILLKKSKYLNKTLNKLTNNMNTDLLLEKLFFELKDVK